MCILISYKDHQDVLELEEEDLILLQDEIQGTNDVLTLTEAAEVANDEPEQTRQPLRSSRRQRGNMHPLGGPHHSKFMVRRSDFVAK